MTKAEIVSGANPNKAAFDAMPDAVKKLMLIAQAQCQLQTYVGSDRWVNMPPITLNGLYGYSVYRINPLAPFEREYKTHKIGSSGTAYVYVEKATAVIDRYMRL